MTEFVVIAVAVFAVGCGLGAVLALRGFRRLRRVVRAQVIQARVHLLPPGPGRDAAMLRRTLHAEHRATRDMLMAAPRGLIFRADAGAVLAELSQAVAALDAELSAIGRFLDSAQQRSALATVAPQVRQLIETTYAARQTILRTAVDDRERQLAALRANVALQAAALQTYQRDNPELSI